MDREEVDDVFAPELGLVAALDCYLPPGPGGRLHLGEPLALQHPAHAAHGLVSPLPQIFLRLFLHNLDWLGGSPRPPDLFLIWLPAIVNISHTHSAGHKA